MQVAFFNTQSYERPFYAESGDIRFTFIESPLSVETVDQANGADAVCVFVSDDLSSAILTQLKNMGVMHVALRSTGYDHVDFTAATRLGLTVTHVPSYSPESIAEFALALLLAVQRRFPLISRRSAELDFRLDGLMGGLTSGCTVGIIGTGYIGCAFARLLSGFGCRVIGYDPSPNNQFVELGGSYVELDAIYAQSEVISLHCPLLPATEYLIDDVAFSKMRDGVVIINTARGGIINTTALLRALNSGKVRGVGLDVLEGEQAIFYQVHDELNNNDVQTLLTHPAVLITPHVAFFTQQALESISKTVCHNILSVATGKIENIIAPTV